MSDAFPIATGCVVVREANLNLSTQVNTVLHKHKRFHGSLYVGLGEYISTTYNEQWRVDLLTSLGYLQVDRREDPYAPQQSNGCCTIM